MSKRLLALPLALVAIGLIAAGCGSSSSTNSTTASISKSEFLKQGNAICEEGNEEIGETFESFAKDHNLSEKNPPSKAEMTEVSEEVVPLIRKQVEGVEALGLPEGAEKEAEEVFDAVDAALQEVEEDPSVVAEESGDPFAKANKLAREFGLTKCAEG